MLSTIVVAKRVREGEKLAVKRSLVLSAHKFVRVSTQKLVKGIFFRELTRSFMA